MTIPEVSAAVVRAALSKGSEIAILDVRAEAIFAQAHPLFAASLPLGRLEVEVLDRVPRLNAPVVVYGHGRADAERAVHTLTGLGYTDVSLLAGGLAGWAAEGGELFGDVNVPSKAFGELVESRTQTPMIDAADLDALLAGRRAADGTLVPEGVTVLDARRYDEYHTMSIPTATSVPGGELVRHIESLVPDPSTLVVVNCAGRTRSIIGAQSLINAGIANRVVALRNGTIGWTLAGLSLDAGQVRRHPDRPGFTAKTPAAAGSVARRVGVQSLQYSELDALSEDGTRTVYRFDVRTPEEFSAGHLRQFRSAPGGQLVQETDHFAPVRGAAVTLFSGDGIRAEMTGSWLRQMGWDVYVVEAVAASELNQSGAWSPTLPPLPSVSWATPEELEAWLARHEAAVVDVDPSPRYRSGHLAAALWVARSKLAQAPIPGSARVVVTSSDGTLAAFAAAELADATQRPVSALAGGTAAWAASGRPLVSGDGTSISPVDDVYRRPYEGTGVDPDAMQAYLEWEYGLVAQLERDGTHGFTVLI